MTHCIFQLPNKIEMHGEIVLETILFDEEIFRLNVTKETEIEITYTNKNDTLKMMHSFVHVFLKELGSILKKNQ